MTARSWILTDTSTDSGSDFLSIGPNSAHELPDGDWSVRKRVLSGGMRDGVELIEVSNGPLVFHVVPTRGMSIWKADYRGTHLGWNSPVDGPVHPKFINLADRGGLGWLAGFDEFLVRCGLSSNGPPGQDGQDVLPLHGRIANLPARRVEVSIRTEPPYSITLTGVVEEGGMFLGRLRLTASYTTFFDSNRIEIHDVVENVSAKPALMQMLYHLNVGEPLLHADSTIHVPFRELAPHTDHAAKAIDTYSVYSGPQTVFPEEVFDFKPAQRDGQSLAVLTNRERNLGLGVRWDVAQLPYFIVWKNTQAREDGYVTGLEPSTNFPYFRGHERSQDRIVTLAPGGRWESRWSIEAVDTRSEVEKLVDEVGAIQGDSPGVVHRTPVFGPHQ